MRKHLLPLLAAAVLAASGSTAPAQTPTVPAPCVADKDGTVRRQTHSALYPNTTAGSRRVRPADGDQGAEPLAVGPGVSNPGDLSNVEGDQPFEQFAADSTGPSEEQVKRAVVKIIAAAVAQAIATKDDDGSLGAAILREVARSARDALVLSTLEDLFPDMPSQDRKTAANLISLALDNKLTAQDLTERQAKDAIQAKLRRQNPDMANAAEVADFVYRVMQSQSH